MSIKGLYKIMAEARVLKGTAEKEYLEEFGHRLRDKREALGLSQAQLAGLCGIARTSITNMEAGNQDPPLGTLMAIGAALGVDPKDLLPNLTEEAQVG